MTDTEITLCGHTVLDTDGHEEPCNRLATGWRWYQDVEHEPCLEPACEHHSNEGGERMHRAEAEVAELRAEVADLKTRLGIEKARTQVANDLIQSLRDRTEIKRVEDYATEEHDRANHLQAEVADLRDRLAGGHAALAMSDHEPTNRVWHEQMQRVRAALGDADIAWDECPLGVHGRYQRTPARSCPWCVAEDAEAKYEALREAVAARVDEWCGLADDMVLEECLPESEHVRRCADELAALLTEGVESDG